MRVKYLIIPLILLVNSALAFCLDINIPKHDCRYPIGDEWCQQKYQGEKPFAYISKCHSLPRQKENSSFDLKSYYGKNRSQSNEKFLQKFPYKKYLQKVSFTNFKILQKHRNYLNKKQGIGDDFLYYLGENFINLYPVYLSQLKAKIGIGEAYISSRKKLISRRANEAYEIIGYYILGKVARKIEQAIKSGNFDQKQQDNKQLIERLKRNRTYLSIEQSTFEKLFKNMKKGNFEYILDRVQKKITETFSDEEVSSLKLSDYKKYYPIGGGDYAVNILSVKKDNKHIGYSIWLKRPDIKAKYFAYKTNQQTVTQKYKHWVATQNKKVVLVTSGGFTNNSSQPEGLTVESGNIVNGVLMPDRDGLVIVEKNGGIRVINLKRKTVKLPTGHGQAFNLSPNKNLIDYSKLLNWCKKYKATLFQTQLLAFSDQLLSNHKNAKTQLRERRILAMVRDKKTNQLYHVIFHIPHRSNLGVLSKEIYDMLRRNRKIEAILNLDVGSYDILKVFDHKSQLLHKMVGPININSATNLIVYTRN
ncbi:MAG: hypothetical protein ABFS56_17010 [Pseudomonadota bacterium]